MERAVKTAKCLEKCNNFRKYKNQQIIQGNY